MTRTITMLKMRSYFFKTREATLFVQPTTIDLLIFKINRLYPWLVLGINPDVRFVTFICEVEQGKQIIQNGRAWEKKGD